MKQDKKGKQMFNLKKQQTVIFFFFIKDREKQRSTLREITSETFKNVLVNTKMLKRKDFLKMGIRAWIGLSRRLFQGRRIRLNVRIMDHCNLNILSWNSNGLLHRVSDIHYFENNIGINIFKKREMEIFSNLMDIGGFICIQKSRLWKCRLILKTQYQQN